MDFDQYQERSKQTDSGTVVGTHYVYLTLGLAGEAGELVNKVKKIFRDDGGELTEERKEAILQELGDSLWYIAQLATAFDVKLSDVAQSNIDKLLSRKSRGAIGGSGDNR